MKRHRSDLLMQASEMWKSGKTWKEIAPILNVKKRRFSELCTRRRDLFPEKKTVPTGFAIERASAMWKNCEPALKISRELGIPKDQLANLIAARPDTFPKRYASGSKISFVKPAEKIKQEPKQRKKPTISSNTMGWVTVEGAFVTLPRISFIECPRITA